VLIVNVILSFLTHSVHGLLLINRPKRDGRLSWSGWLIHSGDFTTEWSYVNYRSGVHHWKCPPAKDRRSNHWATPPTN